MAGLLKKKDPPKKTGFVYQKRTVEDTKKRATQTGGSRDSIVIDGIKLFNPKEGDHDIRIMPPSWDGAKHYGYDIWLHYGIGADENSYVCLRKMSDQPCPCCEEHELARKDNDNDLAAALDPKRRVGVWVIDRKNEDDGPLFWPQPWTVDRDISNLAIDKKTGELYAIDDPDEGFDVAFTVTGKGKAKKYSAFQISRRSSPLSDSPDKQDEWLQFIMDNPLPSVLNLVEYDYMANSLSGGVRQDDKDDKKDDKYGKKDEEPAPASKRASVGRRSKKDDDPPPAPPPEDPPFDPGTSGEGQPEEQQPTWEEIHAMSEEEITKLVEDNEIDESNFAKCQSVEDLADVICSLFEIKPPAPPEPPAPVKRGLLGRGKPAAADPPPAAEPAGTAGSLRDRLTKLKGNRK